MHGLSIFPIVSLSPMYLWNTFIFFNIVHLSIVPSSLTLNMQQNPNALCMYIRWDYHLTNAPHGLQKMEAHLDMSTGLPK
jgi:hypothetical protein